MARIHGCRFKRLYNGKHMAKRIPLQDSPGQVKLPVGQKGLRKILFT